MTPAGGATRRAVPSRTRRRPARFRRERDAGGSEGGRAAVASKGEPL